MPLVRPCRFRYVRTSAARNTAEEHRRQEEELRQALLETLDFKRHKNTVESVATNEEFMTLLDRTIGEARDLREQLNDRDVQRNLLSPKLSLLRKRQSLQEKLNKLHLNSKDEEVLKLHLRLQQHAARKELQKWIGNLLPKDHEQVQGAGGIHNWFVLDSKGLFLARCQCSGSA